jgi:pyridoxine 5-phosphate synthase
MAVKLGVNIDHIATLRQARAALVPDPVEAARACELAGCDSVVCHLREDRRHINDDDVARLKASVRTRLNLEMSAAKDIVDIACRIRPDQATLVPEKRIEVTTEGGLDVAKDFAKIAKVVSRLKSRGIEVSLFVDPSRRQIDASRASGAGVIELHTGEYAGAASAARRRKELGALRNAVKYALSIGLEVNAGHGLDYDNVAEVARISGVNELNIGYSIVARSVFIGLGRAVEEMIGKIR